MKQMRSILAPLLMLLTGVLMTSCDDGYFTGYIDSGDGKQSFFQLERVEDNGYDYDYGWDFRAQRPLQTKGAAEKGK